MMTEILVAGVIASSLSYDNEDGRRAADMAARAYYNYSGLEKAIDDRINPFSKKLERKIPTNIKNVTAGIVILGRWVKDNRIEFSWSF